MTLFNYTWEFIINFLESFFVILFMDDKMTLKTYKTRAITLSLKISFVVLSALHTSLFNYYDLSFQLNYLGGFILYSAFSILFYTSNIASKLFFSTIYLAITLTSEEVVTNLLCIFFHVSPNDYLAGESLRIPATILYIGCISILVFISHFIKWDIFVLSPIETIVYIIISIGGFYPISWLASVSIKSYSKFHDITFSNELITISSFYTILFLILLGYIYKLNSTKEKNKKLNEEKHQLLLEEAEYKNLMKLTNSLRILKHDMRHHLSTIQLLAQKNNFAELNEYIQNYIGSFDESHQIISTGNAAIDGVLSTNITEALNKGIAVDYTLSVPHSFSLDPILTSSLLGNLWTNAITACENLKKSFPEGNTYINFYMRPVENMFLISIENSYDGNIRKNKKGQYLSLKRKDSIGIGLKRIHEIVENNDGIIDIDDDNHKFYVHIMFPLEDPTYENCNTRR